MSQPQDPHQGSLQSCYDSGLEESETPSSKSSSGPRLGALPLPEDNYERTTPDGSVGEAEHMENGRGKHNTHNTPFALGESMSSRLGKRSVGRRGTLTENFSLI